jgi:hypothetical protein
VAPVVASTSGGAAARDDAVRARGGRRRLREVRREPGSRRLAIAPPDTLILRQGWSVACERRSHAVPQSYWLQYYRYEFTRARDHTPAWWKRTRVGEYLPVLTRDDPRLGRIAEE